MAKNISKVRKLRGNKRSHALNATNRFQKPNLQVAYVDGKKVKLTAKEIKTLKKRNEI